MESETLDKMNPGNIIEEIPPVDITKTTTGSEEVSHELMNHTDNVSLEESKTKSSNVARKLQLKDITADKSDTAQSLLSSEVRDKQKMTDVDFTKVLEKRYQEFMDPMLKEMAVHVKKNEDILDQINEKIYEDREKRRKARLSAHVPEEIKGSGKELSYIMKKLEELITSEDTEHIPDFYQLLDLQKLDEYSQGVILSHSLATQLGTLRYSHRARIFHKIGADCRHWICDLFRLPEGRVIYHDHVWDGVVRITRLALHQHFTKYAADGFEALYSRPPVIYISSAAHHNYRRYISIQLGLPESCITVVPCNTVFGSNHVMDVAVLEKLIEDDTAAAKTPLLLVANAGTPDVGQVDKLERLQSICQKNNIWLHIDGSQLATLVLYTVPPTVSPAKLGDSMTLSPGPWFDVPALPCVTLFRSTDLDLCQMLGLTVDLSMSCLPIWICLQNFGYEGVVARVQHKCNLAEQMSDALLNIPSIKQLTKEKEVKEDKTVTLSSLISKAVNAMLFFGIVSPTVVFKFCPNQEKKASEGENHFHTPESKNRNFEYNRQYQNSLNSWLIMRLNSGNTRVRVNTVDLDKEGVCVRFCPLEITRACDITKEDIENFISYLKDQIDVLLATVNNRTTFQDLVETEHGLRIVNSADWAGLGIVQYIPEEENDTNSINSELAYKLKALDSAFSLGDINGSACIRFGLINDQTDVAQLVSMVTTTGKEVEESSKYIEKMSSVIKQGIYEMNKELEKEFANKIKQEGVFRQMPLFSSLVNWWSPPPKNSMVGRSFNIQSGKIHSTQDTYKYHMQVQEES